MRPRTPLKSCSQRHSVQRSSSLSLLSPFYLSSGPTFFTLSLFLSCIPLPPPHPLSFPFSPTFNLSTSLHSSPLIPLFIPLPSKSLPEVSGRGSGLVPMVNRGLARKEDGECVKNQLSHTLRGPDSRLSVSPSFTRWRPLESNARARTDNTTRRSR